MDSWTIKQQVETKRQAERHGEVWTSAELELLSAFAEESIKELALTLGRTYLAVATMRSAVSAGKITEAAAPRARVAISDRPYRGWVEGMGDE